MFRIPTLQNGPHRNGRSQARKAALAVVVAVLCTTIVSIKAETARGQDKTSGFSRLSALTNALTLFRVDSSFGKTVKVHDSIYQASGLGNTFMVTTDEGNVIIDTSLSQMAPMHKRVLQAVDDSPVKYIILTHGHVDHTGGVDIWKEKETQVIAQQNSSEFMHYQSRLAPFFASRNAAQYGVGGAAKKHSGNEGGKILATITFDKKYEFKLGGLTFEIYHTPGETSDHLSVWIPELKAAFVGDNYYRSFPNLYTLRGTKPRWALDYVDSLGKVLDWKPEFMLPGHGPALSGNEEITQKLTRQRDAILYVHDATVQGMNNGKSVHALMREIKLPEHLQVSEHYGSVAWGVRGIYQGYVGWFDGDPATMYATPPSEAYPEIVALAGGAERVADRAAKLVRDGHPVQALHLADMALASDQNNVRALQARLDALKALQSVSVNAIEKGWLSHGIRGIKQRLETVSKL